MVGNIKIGLKGIGWDGTDRIDVARYTDSWWIFVNAVVKLLVPHSSDDFLIDCGTVTFS
jgi:hypothetical protein